jgi:hypothetical protein
MSDLRTNIHMLISGLSGWFIGRGLGWWLLDGNNPSLMLLGILLFGANAWLQMNRKPKRGGVMSMSIMIGPGGKAVPFPFPLGDEIIPGECDEMTREVPIVFPMCEHCRDSTCKKSSNYSLAKRPDETDEEYKERMA